MRLLEINILRKLCEGNPDLDTVATPHVLQLATVRSDQFEMRLVEVFEGGHDTQMHALPESNITKKLDEHRFGTLTVVEVSNFLHRSCDVPIAR